MNLIGTSNALKVAVDFKLDTPLLLRSGTGNELVDNTVETDARGNLYIKGEVWASLLRRSLMRLNDGIEIAKETGKYSAFPGYTEEQGKNSVMEGVSAFWFQDSFVELPCLDVRTGNKIDRRWGSAEVGALYTEESVPPGLRVTMHFLYFGEKITMLKRLMPYSLWIIDKGIENIGGGWSYGFGRLKFERIRWEELDLRKPEERRSLWSTDFVKPESDSKLPEHTDAIRKIGKPWVEITAAASIEPGQLLAVHDPLPPFDFSLSGDKLPDSFVFTRSRVFDDSNLSSEVVIPGKTLRQGLFSVNIERELRTELGSDSACLDSTKSNDCRCLRCEWFGSTCGGGIIAVFDAPLHNYQKTILSRIQLCEHSMQNINLFEQEYLKKGDFNIRILIDLSMQRQKTALLIQKIKKILSEMRADNCPPGWYRIGATSTCTGQIRITASPQETLFGEIKHEDSRF